MELQIGARALFPGVDGLSRWAVILDIKAREFISREGSPQILQLRENEKGELS